MALHKNLIAGEWVEGQQVSQNINPSNTGDVIGDYSYGDQNSVDQAVAAALTASHRWSRSGIQQRHDVEKD